MDRLVAIWSCCISFFSFLQECKGEADSFSGGTGCRYCSIPDFCLEYVGSGNWPDVLSFFRFRDIDRNIKFSPDSFLRFVWCDVLQQLTYKTTHKLFLMRFKMGIRQIDENQNR